MRSLTSVRAIAMCALLALASATGAQLGPRGNVLLTDSVPDADAQFSDAMTSGGFDGDAAPDLAVAAPRHGSDGSDGRVTVFLNRNGELVGGLYQGQIEGEPGAQLGTALASCDFNGDGRDELAIGVPGDGNFGGMNAGAVHIHELAAAGAPDSWQWTQVRTLAQGDALGGASVEGDRLGSALACGDFDDDGYADLAIGVPGKDIPLTNINGGQVVVIYGSANGLNSFTDEIWNQDTVRDGFAVRDQVEDGDGFGSTLAVGDFDRDGFDDLVVGVPNEDILSMADSGGVHVLFGSAGGVSPLRQAFIEIDWLADEFSAGDFAEPGDRLGWALAVGDFNRSDSWLLPGYQDLAISAPFKDALGAQRAGIVYVLDGGAGTDVFGEARRIRASDTDLVVESYEGFGFALAAGNFDGDRQQDLAIGREGRDVGTTLAAGTVTVLFGRPSGLHDGAASQSFDASAAYASSPPGYVFGFGATLVAADFDGDRSSDLAIGIRDQTVGGVEQAGAVQMIFTAGLFKDGFE